LRAALLDAGPLIGLVNRADSHREGSIEAVRASAAAGRRISTTWEAVGEAYTVIRLRMAAVHEPHAALAVLRWAWESGVTVFGSVEEDHERAAQILQQRGDKRLSYFDALLMAVAERHEIEELITVDGGHFRGVRLAHAPIVTVV